jgi:hypothetical protein
MNKKILVAIVGIILMLSIGVGSVQAGGDNNTNTHGEDDNYEDNNNNPYDDEDFPGQDSQQRSGVVW